MCASSYINNSVKIVLSSLACPATSPSPALLSRHPPAFRAVAAPSSSAGIVRWGVQVARPSLLLRPLVAGQKQIKRAANAGVAQTRDRHDSHDLDAFFKQLHDLLAPLVKLVECLFCCVFFFLNYLKMKN